MAGKSKETQATPTTWLIDLICFLLIPRAAASAGPLNPGIVFEHVNERPSRSCLPNSARLRHAPEARGGANNIPTRAGPYFSKRQLRTIRVINFGTKFRWNPGTGLA